MTEGYDTLSATQAGSVTTSSKSGLGQTFIGVRQIWIISTVPRSAPKPEPLTL